VDYHSASFRKGKEGREYLKVVGKRRNAKDYLIAGPIV
jgi:hypothetical protein